MYLHACEYSATGYFGSEGSDIDLYIYCAVHVAIPRYGEGTRAVARTKPFVVSSSARPRRQEKGRMKTGARIAVNPGQPFELIPFFCNQLPWFGMAHRVILAFACRTERQ
jgi:hypothetical protein